MEWLTAVRSGDPLAIKRAQLNIAARRAGLRTPNRGGGGCPTATPRATTGRAFTGATTQLRNLATPAMTPFEAVEGFSGEGFSGSATPLAAAAAAAAAGGAGGSSGSVGGVPRAPTMGLDAFLGRYTGEDNASFAVIQEAANARKRARVAHHLTDKNAPLLLEGPHATDEFGSSGQAPGTLLPWKHVAKSALYYDSSQRAMLPYSETERALMVQGPAKAIRHANTRIPGAGDDDTDAIADAAAAAVAADAAAEAAAVADVMRVAAGGATPAPGAASNQEAGANVPAPAALKAPGTRGYGYLSTPTVAPDASPFMTWGEIEGTPLRLDLDDELGLGLSGGDEKGPVFKLPEIRRREAAATAALAARGGVGKRHPVTSGRKSTTPLLETLRSRQPGTPLSSAAQRLASSLRKGGAGASVTSGDAQLRASYSRSAVTPSPRVTPGSTARAAVSGASTPRIGSAGRRAVGVAATAAGSSGAGGSITDDLLKI